jgi:hypothetical protein
MGEMVWHIWGLMNWIHLHLYQHEASRPRAITDQRDHALEMIQKIRGSILEIGDGGIGEVRIEGLPFWHMINGPIADAISHVGQINTLRRLHGKVPIQANVFLCRPPMEI